MPDIQIRITNLPQIKRAFGMAPTLMKRNLNKGIQKAVLNVRTQELQQYGALGIRIISRGLWSSIIRGVYTRDLYGEVGPNVTGSPGVNYAIWVHEGTRRMRPRPFLRNAVQKADPLIQQGFQVAVQDTLNAIGKAT